MERVSPNGRRGRNVLGVKENEVMKKSQDSRVVALRKGKVCQNRKGEGKLGQGNKKGRRRVIAGGGKGR